MELVVDLIESEFLKQVLIVDEVLNNRVTITT